MPETPVYDLPYPPPTGVAPDVPYYMQQLAEATEAALAGFETYRTFFQTFASGNTDSQGFRTLLHSCPFTPVAVFVVNLTPATAFGVYWGCDQIDSDSFRARFMTGSSAADGPLVSLPTGTLAAWMVALPA